MCSIIRDCQEFRARRGGSTDQAMAVVKRSPNRTANWDLAMAHSRGGMIHSFSERFNTRKRSLVAASSLGKWPLARTARRSVGQRAGRRGVWVMIPEGGPPERFHGSCVTAEMPSIMVCGDTCLENFRLPL